MIGEQQITEWLSVKGEGLTSAVGEYTPAEFWELLDEFQQQTVRVAELEKSLADKTADFRDRVALGATDDEIMRFRDGYPNPAGGPKIFYRHTIEQARYRYADAVLAARTPESPC